MREEIFTPKGSKQKNNHPPKSIFLLPFVPKPFNSQKRRCLCMKLLENGSRIGTKDTVEGRIKKNPRWGGCLANWILGRPLWLHSCSPLSSITAQRITPSSEHGGITRMSLCWRNGFSIFRLWGFGAERDFHISSAIWGEGGGDCIRNGEIFQRFLVLIRWWPNLASQMSNE